LRTADIMQAGMQRVTTAEMGTAIVKEAAGGRRCYHCPTCQQI